MRTRRIRHRPVSRRRREERRRVIRRRAMIAAGLLLAGMAMTPQLRGRLADAVHGAMEAVETMAMPGAAQAQITLPKKTVYALQLGVYDNGEHAQDEQTRLTGEGIRCVIWQREQMRLVCDAALSKGRLDGDAAQGNDAWAIREELPEVVLRVSAGAESMDAVRSLLTLPDALFDMLCAKTADLEGIVESARKDALEAQQTHRDHALYTQLAQSLVNWCDLIDGTREACGQETAQSYARVTMCTLCYELRQALMAESAASTASAQRTPSTAADVMPPA